MTDRARGLAAWGLALLVALGAPARAADKVTVGVFPVSSSLPFFVAQDRGYFKAHDLDVEMVRLIGGPPNVAAMIGDQIDASAVLVTIEGINANLKKPGVAMYISLNTQNRSSQMEQFVVRKGYPAQSIKDLKGAKIMSAPGPANLSMARAVLAANGLKEGDYTLDQLDMAQHVSAMQSGSFDAGYTLEPGASIMRTLGVATTLEAGVVATYILGDPNANAFVGGCALTSKFITDRPAAAKRFNDAWAKAVKDVNTDPTVRKVLVDNKLVPENVADTVPLLKVFMAGDLSPADKTAYQKFIDFSVDNKILAEKVDVAKYLKAF
jgi:NitT/TauT family transport system substrate-binding protein